MFGISKEEVMILKEKYKPGTRVELDYINDIYRTNLVGCRGTVRKVDDIGQIHVDWDNGSAIALHSREDSFRIIDDEEFTGLFIEAIDVESYPQNIRKPTTVGELRKYLEGHADDEPILVMIDDEECHFGNVIVSTKTIFK